jgi:hypothetical protein
MSSPAVVIATAKVRPGSEDALNAWNGRRAAVREEPPKIR